jgi:WD40 repeat protein
MQLLKSLQVHTNYPFRKSSLFLIIFRDRVTAAAIDETGKFLAIGSEKGEAKILNRDSGGVVYDLPKASSEISCMTFLRGATEYWLAAGTWGGKLIMWSQPLESNNYTISQA